MMLQSTGTHAKMIVAFYLQKSLNHNEIIFISYLFICQDGPIENQLINVDLDISKNIWFVFIPQKSRSIESKRDYLASPF